MESSKYISPLFQDLYTRRYITHDGTKLKTVYLFNIIDMFINRWQFFNKDNMKLNTRTLKSLYGSTYPKYLDYLIQNDFIFLWKNYSVGLKAKSYRLTENAKRAGTMTVNIEMPDKLINKMRNINMSFNSVDDYMKKKLIRDLYEVDIDLDGARQWLDDNIDKNDKAHQVNMVASNKIKNKDIYYSFDNYGRFHTNFTVLKKEIRNRFLRFGEHGISELDITNSQPFFLYILMRDSGFTAFDGFDVDVLTGHIYERLTGVSGKTRKEVKVSVYSVLFGRNMTKDYWNVLFGQLYPNVYKWIKEYKKKNKSYKVIAQDLQKIESDFIFNNLIPNVLMKYRDLPIITIHDSIIIPDYAYDNVKVIFRDTKLDLINNELKLKFVARKNEDAVPVN